MAEYPEGTHWHAYGSTYSESQSMAFIVDEQDLTSVIKESDGYVAISLVTGGLLTPRLVELNEAAAVAEAEALNPRHP